MKQVGRARKIHFREALKEVEEMLEEKRVEERCWKVIEWRSTGGEDLAVESMEKKKCRRKIESWGRNLRKIEWMEERWRRKREWVKERCRRKTKDVGEVME